jgi:hypothetical protein
MYERRAVGLVVGFGCLLAVGCQDHGQAGAGSGGAVAVAVAGSPAPAASLDPALPATPPATPIYEVPVTRADLEPFATFSVGRVDWNVSDANARLEYDFPAALSGVTGQSVSLEGSVVSPGLAELNGPAGAADCRFSSQAVRCSEMMTGLATAPSDAQRMLQALPAAEQMLRGQVIQVFSADPIGFITFALDEGSGSGASR